MGPSPRAPPLKSGRLSIYLPRGSAVVRLARAFLFEEVEARVDGAPHGQVRGRLPHLISYASAEAVPRRLRERAYPAAAVAGSPVAEERRRGLPPVRPETLRGAAAPG